MSAKWLLGIMAWLILTMLMLDGRPAQADEPVCGRDVWCAGFEAELEAARADQRARDAGAAIAAGYETSATLDAADAYAEEAALAEAAGDLAYADQMRMAATLSAWYAGR